MKLVCISDTHCVDLTTIKLPKGDLLVHAGDFTYGGKHYEVMEAMRQLEIVASKFKYGAVIIAGNHDWLFEREPAFAKTLIPPNVKYLNDEHVEIGGIHIWGSPVQPRFYDWAFNRDRGDEISRHWAMIPDYTDLLITHGPPLGILDKTKMTGEHVGCFDLMKKIKEIKPKVHVFGHIHDGHGVIKEGETTFVNASVLSDQYKLTYKAVRLTI